MISFFSDKLFYFHHKKTKEEVLVPGLPLHYPPTAKSNFPEIIDELCIRYGVKDVNENGERSCIVIGAGIK
jgi:hypothetical protein